jgi:hypothetical protein
MGILLVTSSWAPAAGGAEEDPVVLSWSAPPESPCPDAAYVLREIRRRVGAAHPDRRPIRATVTIRAARAAGPFQMTLETEQADTKGERVLQDESCVAVADAAVVVLAWMIDPTTMGGEPREPRPSARPQVEENNIAQHDRPPNAGANRLKPFFGAAASGDAGTGPAMALGVEVRAGVSLDVLRWALYGSFWPHSSKTVATLADGRSIGGTFTLAAIGLRACVAPPLGSGLGGASLSLCVGPEIDALRGRGFGVSAPGEGTKIWVAGAAAAQGAFSLGGPLHLFVSIAGVVPATREHFSLQGVGEVHQPSPLAARASAGIEWAP